MKMFSQYQGFTSEQLELFPPTFTPSLPSDPLLSPAPWGSPASFWGVCGHLLFEMDQIPWGQQHILDN